MRSDGPKVNNTLCCCKQSTCLRLPWRGGSSLREAEAAVQQQDGDEEEERQQQEMEMAR